MKILIFNWRDTRNPSSGGAEVYIMELAKRWVSAGHQVTLFCAQFKDADSLEWLEGVQIIRKGNRWTVYWEAYRYYQREAQGKYDLVIDSVNTLPFFTPFYVREKKLMIFYQLAREVWFYEAFFPLNVIGYLSEGLYLKSYRNTPCVTISESSKKDLLRLGFKLGIAVFNPGIFVEPLKSIPIKEEKPTLIYVGRLKKSKRVHHVIHAFSKIKKNIPRAQLWIVGAGTNSYENSLRNIVRCRSIMDVIFFGRVSEEKKMELMKRAHLILVTSVREGWGIIVIEAAAVGTPAVVYEIPGLRDSVLNGLTGYCIPSGQADVLSSTAQALLSDSARIIQLAEQSLSHARNFSWDKIASDFMHYLESH